MADPILSGALAYFVKIAEVGSLTAAARALRISQPSLTVAVKRLEEELGTTLLVRTGRGVTLTRTGEVLIRHARHALRALELAREEIHGLEEEPRGQFTLGCHESLGAYLLPGFMAKFLERWPKIQLSLWNGNSREVERAVVERQVDVGLVVNCERHPDCVVQPLFADQVRLIVSAALKKRARGAPRELLATHPVLFVPAIRQAQYILGALAAEQLGPARQLPCQSMELVKSLVLDGVGTGILPYRVATHGVASGRLVSVDEGLPCFDDEISLVWRSDLHETAAARLLLNALKEHGKQMPPLS